MNNGKKYLIIASGVLVVLMIGVFILQNLLTKGTVLPQQNVPTPTLDPYKYPNGYPRAGSQSSSGKTPASSSTSSSIIEAKGKTQLEQIKRMLPLETDDYAVKYSPNLDKIVVTRKTPEAEGAFNDWLINHNLPVLVNNPATTIYSDKTMEEVQTPYASMAPIKRINMAIDFFSLILNPAPPAMLKLSPSPTPKPTTTPTPAQSSSNDQSSSNNTPPKEYGGYVYYSQCHGQYDNYPLAPGCTVCKAGCGPTTVAMILSTYVDKKYTPPVVVEIYKDIGAAACGTGLGYAKSVLSGHGVKTSDYIIPYTGAQHDVKDVADDLRAYINNGWTIFVLAAYPGGHYFWMTDITSSGNVMAFDPYYGMDQTPPINENIRYPYPKYLAAFGVKKT